MTKDLIVSTTPQETKVALLEDGRVSEIFIEREAHRGVVGNIYKGRVTRVLPGMQSAFVDLGLERDAFLYVTDVLEGLDENLLTAEERASGTSPSNGGAPDGIHSREARGGSGKAAQPPPAQRSRRCSPKGRTSWCRW